MIRTPRDWSPSVIAALVAAAMLLAAGVLMAVYQEHLYSSQQVRSVREQAQILAASVGAAVMFDDHNATQEYVDALRVNPELEGAGIYDARGRLMAGFARGTRLPVLVTVPRNSFGEGYIDIAVPVSQNGDQVGLVLLRAVTEPEERRIARYAGLILLVTMGALVIAVLSFSQAALSRRAQELARVNNRLQEEMEERRKTEEALRQSHKMEAIGQLSGGIAHDFNNLIMIVKGNLRLLKRKLGAEVEQGATYLASADEALDRAAHLTQRILAFSRRQPLTPQRVNLSTLAQGLSQLVRHSVGEKVEITMQLTASWSILCDINQMENVLLNLAINARDAMPNGGRLVVETRNTPLIKAPPDVEGEFVPGDYVALAVIDTGTGMPDDVRRRAVDPFFTTKPQGKGTGLGLSMTFGFVRQSGGYLVIDSAPGKGTAITILMPRDQEAA
ncbi:MAG TPA: ATP-binding protein [Rhizomicrobium sp.]|nr:ATP-binding protein [Rhizomicrobium sp.]